MLLLLLLLSPFRLLPLILLLGDDDKLLPFVLVVTGLSASDCSASSSVSISYVEFSSSDGSVDENSLLRDGIANCGSAVRLVEWLHLAVMNAVLIEEEDVVVDLMMPLPRGEEGACCKAEDVDVVARSATHNAGVIILLLLEI